MLNTKSQSDSISYSSGMLSNREINCEDNCVIRLYIIKITKELTKDILINQSILEGLIRAMPQLTECNLLYLYLHTFRLFFKPSSMYKSIFLSTLDVQIGLH